VSSAEFGSFETRALEGDMPTVGLKQANLREIGVFKNGALELGP
jgi:hypothetical protein